MSSLSARALDVMLAAGPMSILAKVTVTLVAAGAIAVMASRASAAIRHLIWLTALVACAALVVVTPIAPRIRVVSRASRGIIQVPRVMPTAVSVITVRPRMLATAFSPRRFVTVTTPRIIPVTSRLILRRIRSWNSRHAGILLVGLWATGFLAVIGRFVFGLRGVARLVDSSTPLDEYGWTRDLMLAAESAGVERPVRLVMHASLSSPITAGSMFPVIMVPTDADEWSAQRRRVVLVHELAHIARFDFAAQFLATILTAIFWFNPIMWFAAARLRDEAEQAADDYVIADGTTGVAYASHLLDIARELSPHHFAAVAAVGMVRSTRLETRFRAMLDADRPRSAISMPLRIAAVVAAVALMVPVAGLRSVANASPRFARARVAAPRVEKRTIVTAPGVIASARTQLVDSLIERTIDAESGRKLILDLETGAGITIHAWDQSRVRVRGALGGRDWRDARLALDRVGSDVRVSTTFVGDQRSRSTEVELEIWAPRHTDVDVKSAGGSIEVDSLQGTFSGETGGGEIVMDGATGRALLSTGGGRILVTNSDLNGSITTGGGEIVTRNSRGSLSTSSSGGYSYSVPTTMGVGRDGIREGIATTISSGVGGSVAHGVAKTISGGVGTNIADGITTTISRGFGVGIGQGVGVCSATISNSVGSTVVSTGGGYGFGPSTITNTNTTTSTSKLRGTGATYGYVPTRAGDIVQIHKPGGSIDVDDAPFGATLSTGGGGITVASSHGAVVASTGGGDINLESVAGDAVASTGSGTVTISVVNADGTEHSISVCSGHGDVILELPAQLDASIELETAYTENFGRMTSIDSDISLNRTATTEWDDRFGSPRKFVRASGVAGNGAGRIRVQTVNGDIIVRRR